MDDIYEYIVIAKVKHFNKKFLVLFNKTNGNYFLEITDKGYKYPLFEEFIELKKIYNSLGLNAYYKKMNLKPLVNFKNKLISAILVSSMVFTMQGCTNKDSMISAPTLNDLEQCGVTVSDGLIKDDSIYYITGIDFDNPKIEQVLGKTDPKLQYSYKEIVTMNEFTKRLNIQNKTYEDVIEVLKLNKNINDKDKTLLENAINNLKKSNLNINLGLLYYNLKDLKVVYTDELSVNAIAVFDENSREVSILKNIDLKDYSNLYEKVVIHEIIGHGLTSAYSEELKILCGPEIVMLTVDETETMTSSTGFGNAFKEGLVDLIASIAYDKKITSKDCYSTEAYTVKLISELYDIPLSEIADMGIEKLVSFLKEQGLKDSITLFNSLDSVMYAKMDYALEDDYVTTSNIAVMLNNFVIQEFNNGKTKEDIIEKINNTFDNMKNFFEYEICDDGEILYSAVSENCFSYIVIDYIYQQVITCCEMFGQESLQYS